MLKVRNQGSLRNLFRGRMASNSLEIRLRTWFQGRDFRSWALCQAPYWEQRLLNILTLFLSPPHPPHPHPHPALAHKTTLSSLSLSLNKTKQKKKPTRTLQNLEKETLRVTFQTSGLFSYCSPCSQSCCLPVRTQYTFWVTESTSPVVPRPPEAPDSPKFMSFSMSSSLGCFSMIYVS